MLGTWRAEYALQILTPPPEQQIGIDVVPAGHQRNRSSCFERLLDQVPLGLDLEVWSLALRDPIQCLVHFSSHQII